MNRKLLKYLALGLLLCAAGCAKKHEPPEPHQVTVTKPISRSVPVYLDYVGHMVANISVQVMAQASGILTNQYFTEGQDVKQGDLLLTIDPRPYEATLARAEAVLQQTTASFQYAKDTTRRYTPLVQEDFVSKQNFDQFVTNEMTTEAQISQSRADVETARINLGYCYITAPMNCITGQLLVKTGNYVDPNAGTVLTTLNQICPILVDFYVPESDLLVIQKHQSKGTLKLFVYPDPAHSHQFEGALTLINNQINTSTGTVLLEGTLPNDSKLLWPGHFVDVRVILEEEKKALLIPTEAVVVGQSGHFVYVVNDQSTIEMRPIKAGQVHGSMRVIESGITPKDQVVVEGQLNIYTGMKVAIKGA